MPPAAIPESMSSHFAETLKRLREQAGWTTQELAERSGVSRPHVSRLEAGLREPSLSTLLKLARALGVRLDAFDPGE